MPRQKESDSIGRVKENYGASQADINRGFQSLGSQPNEFRTEEQAKDFTQADAMPLLPEDPPKSGVYPFEAEPVSRRKTGDVPRDRDFAGHKGELGRPEGCQR